MKIKELSLLFVLVGFTFLSSAQSENGKYILFKLYKNAVFNLGNTQSTTTVSLSNFTPSIAWGKDENFQEVQITSINFESRGQNFLYSGGAEYTYNHRFSDDNESKFHFFFGGGLGASFSTKNSSIETTNSIMIHTIGKFINLNVVVIPRVTYDLSNKLGLELSLAYNVFDYENSKQTSHDSAVPVNARTNVYNTTRFFPSKFSLRIAGVVNF